MNSSKKESIAITAIINEANKFDNLEDNLRKRDREPVWDGDLCLYQTDSNKSDEIMGRIPVQVKGIEEIIDTQKETIDYSVKISDIENYKKDKKGAIFFVVEVFENRDTAIYYKVFDIGTINEVLKTTKKGQKTKRFQFDRLKANQLISICIEFIKKLELYEDVIPIKAVEVYNKKTICYDYNTKYELEEIKKSNDVFYETNAYREAKEKLEKQNVIILHGEPWVGKTSTARKLVMNYIEQGYVFLYGNVDDLVEIKNKVSMEGKIICLLDDFLGSNVRYLEKNVAESTLDKIINIFKNSKDKKLILTTRTYIYNNSKQLFYKFYHATGIKDEYLIDVANYNYMEKGNILYNHLKKNNILGTVNYTQILNHKFYEEIINHENFNPGVIALICERMRDKQIDNVKEYIKGMLNDPERLWEEEYQKLSDYEKIILIIIVLFGVKVPEKYIKEQFNQIIKNENIKIINSETFEKSIDMLSISFVKVTFNEDDEKELEVCKHSVADYIISKIKKGNINIKRYIDSAKYVEVLHYIDMIARKNNEIQEMLAQKVERDLNVIKDFFYNKIDILYDILEKNLNPKRVKILKKIIVSAFSNYDINLILSILENDYSVTYEYTLEMLKEYIIDKNDDEILYRLRYVSDCEEFFGSCLEIVDYKKNSEYMLNSFETVKDILIEIVSEDVENTIEEIMLERVAEDILNGKDKKQIVKEFIESVVNDEIPSLRKLYSKKLYQEILENLYEDCYIYIDEEKLQKTINNIKENPKKNEEPVQLRIDKVDFKQREYIREKFEKDFAIESEEEEEDIDLLGSRRVEMYGKWWLESFIDSYFKKTNNIELYYEFTTQKKQIDYSLKSFAREFLDYILYEKNKVSQKAERILSKIAYENFIEGNININQDDIQEYEEKETKVMEELYHSKLLIKKEEKVEFLNHYIYLYMAVNEVMKKNNNLIIIMTNWKEEKYVDRDDNLANMKQKVLQLYSALNTEKFNKEYAIPLLDCFVRILENKRKTNGKIGIAKAMIDLLSINIKLNGKFEIYSTTSRIFEPLWMTQFVTGTEIEWDIGYFDYSIYKEILDNKCYDKENEAYILNFKEILKDKELKKICSELEVWDYLYDIYCESVNVLEALKQNKELDLYHIVAKKFEEKYFI